ncbi:MAG TPA: hypothetical protein VH985_07680, partial [Candidatus Binatia bacterium]
MSDSLIPPEWPHASECLMSGDSSMLRPHGGYWRLRYPAVVRSDLPCCKTLCNLLVSVTPLGDVVRWLFFFVCGLHDPGGGLGRPSRI